MKAVKFDSQILCFVEIFGQINDIKKFSKK